MHIRNGKAFMQRVTADITNAHLARLLFLESVVGTVILTSRLSLEPAL